MRSCARGRCAAKAFLGYLVLRVQCPSGLMAQLSEEMKEKLRPQVDAEGLRPNMPATQL